MTFREKKPSRTPGVATEKDYHNYRKQLRTDFNCRCGYCDDIDIPHSERFEIDHFVPQKRDTSRVTDYSNLVYACRSCNNSKRAKWPTNDPKISNNEKEGWIDPCKEVYSQQFERNEYGEIVATTDLGKWMFDALKLWKPQHEVLWCIEHIKRAFDELRNQTNDYKDIKDLDTFRNILIIRDLKDKIQDRLYI